MRRRLHLTAGLLTIALAPLGACTAPLSAGPTTIADAAQGADYDMRARQLVQWLNGELPADRYFSDYFRTMVPDSQSDALREQLIAQYGPAHSVMVSHRESDTAGQVQVAFDTGTASLDLVISPEAPNKVAGLLFTGFSVHDDSYDRIDAAFAALSGKAGFAVAEIGADGPAMLAARAPEAQFAIGSTFKLYVLAELAAQIREGDSDWASVVPLGRASVPSGIMQDWPQAMPVTQATLATAMISLSDNSATDTLIGQLGRDRIGARIAKIGHGDPALTLPVLTTLEAFALKVEANAGAREAFLSLPEAKQADYLDRFGPTIDRGTISDAELVERPRYIDSIEWFASPADTVALLAYLKRLDDPLLRKLLTISPGVGKSDAARWAYLGYKGGSEPGVVNMSFLGQRPDGRWMAVTGSWNDSNAAVDEAAFGALMTRLLNVAVGAD